MSRKVKRKIGYLFGSFNPIHVGHLMVAEFMATQTDLEHVELIVSPHNPLKNKSDLAGEEHRLAMCQLAVESSEVLSVNDIEFGLPRPSYTIDTLRALQVAHPAQQVCLIMGSDNLAILDKWRSWEDLLSNYEVYVYERPGYPVDENRFPEVKRFKPPLIEVSSTYIRNCVRKGISTRYLIPDAVRDYIASNSLYSQSD